MVARVGQAFSRYSYCEAHWHTSTARRPRIFCRRHDAAVAIRLQGASHAGPGERGHAMEVQPVRVTALRQNSKVRISPGCRDGYSQPSHHEGLELCFGNLAARGHHSREELLESSCSCVFQKLVRRGAYLSRRSYYQWLNRRKVSSE